MGGTHRSAPHFVLNPPQQAQRLQPLRYPAAQYHHIRVEQVQHIAQADNHIPDGGVQRLYGDGIALPGGGEHPFGGNRRPGFMRLLQGRTGGGLGQPRPGGPRDSRAGSQRLQAAPVPAGAGRGVGAGVNGHMSNLAGAAAGPDQHCAIVDNAGAHPGAEGDINQRARRLAFRERGPTGAVVALAQGGQVGVVAHPNRMPQHRGPQVGQPGAVKSRQIGRGQQSARRRVYGTGQGDAGAGDGAVARLGLGLVEDVPRRRNQFILRSAIRVGHPTLPEDLAGPVNNGGARPGAAPVHRQSHRRRGGVKVVRVRSSHSNAGPL